MWVSVVQQSYGRYVLHPVGRAGYFGAPMYTFKVACGALCGANSMSVTERISVMVGSALLFACLEDVH